MKDTTRCETCYSGRWSNEGGLVCNSARSPWPIEPVRRHWCCYLWEARPLGDTLPPNPIGETADPSVVAATNAYLKSIHARDPTRRDIVLFEDMAAAIAAYEQAKFQAEAEEKILADCARAGVAPIVRKEHP